MNRVILVTAALLTACGGGQTSLSKYQQEQLPVTPTGTIVGRVVDVSTAQPLDGVSVKALGSDQATMTTNADGLFTLTNAVVASAYTFVFDKPGYLRSTRSASLSQSAGNSPLANAITTFTQDMYKGDGAVQGNVFLPDGRPAGNATVVVDQRNEGYGDSVVSATTGADGSFKLQGLATRVSGANHNVIAVWYDENNDGNADYASTSVNVQTFPGAVERVFLTYSAGSVPQRVISTNVADAELAPGDDLQFTLALPVLTSNLNGAANRAFVLRDLTREAAAGGTVEVAVEPSWMNSTQVTVHPTSPLHEGSRYRITLSLTNAGATGSNANTSFSTSFDFQVRPPNVTPITDQVTNFTVTNPNVSTTRGVRQFDWDSNSFRLTWDPPAGATNLAGFYIYAKDTLLNPGWVQLSSATVTGQSLPRYTTIVSLPGTFDANSADGLTQPLSMNNKVTFAVVPVDIYGNFSPLASAAAQQVSDNVAPQSLSLVQVSPAVGSLDATNDESTPTSIQLRLNYTEPMDPSTLPVLTTTASTVTQTFVWDNFGSSGSGLLTLTIPAGVDASGPFTIHGGRDSAGNALLNNDFESSFTGLKEVGSNWSFEDSTGACSLSSWTPTNTGGMPLPATVQSSSRTGRCAALLGAIPGTAPQMGLSRLTQDVTLPTLTNTPNWVFYVRLGVRPVYQAGSSAVSISQTCRITDSANNPLAGLYSATDDDQASYSLYTRTLASSLGGTTIRLVCEVNNTSTLYAGNAGLYVDDFSVTIYKSGALY